MSLVNLFGLLIIILFIIGNDADLISYNERYPIYWNVDETNNPDINIIQYNILPRNYTQCGNGCSNINCTSWTQGLWPIIDNNGNIYNGGVPQNGNITAHEEALKQQIQTWIPDVNWNGNAVFDFEDWTTVWDYNTGTGSWHSIRYQQYSIQLVKDAHPNWNETEIYNTAKSEFETAATNWFVKTLQTCKNIRPNAKFGFYGLPLNLNGPCIGSGMNIQCGYNNPTISQQYKDYSDQQIPIWVRLINISIMNSSFLFIN